MSEPTTKYGILVAVDGSAESDAAVRWAAREAVLRDAPVTLAHVVMPVVVARRRVVAGKLQRVAGGERAACDRAGTEDTARQPGRDSAARGATEVLHSDIVPALVDASKEAQMVVVGSRGMGTIGRTLLGSVSSGLVHHAHGPVAIIHADEAQAPDRTSPVLLGIDGSPASEAATALASMKHRAGGWNWSPCTRGAMSVPSPSWVCTGSSTKTRVTKCSANASRVGRSSIPT